MTGNAKTRVNVSSATLIAPLACETLVISLLAAGASDLLNWWLIHFPAVSNPLRIQPRSLDRRT